MIIVSLLIILFVVFIIMYINIIDKEIEESEINILKLEDRVINLENKLNK